MNLILYVFYHLDGKTHIFATTQWNGPTIEFVARQARSICQYKKLRTKVLECCADICFNRQCLYVF